MTLTNPLFYNFTFYYTKKRHDAFFHIQQSLLIIYLFSFPKAQVKQLIISKYIFQKIQKAMSQIFKNVNEKVKMIDFVNYLYKKYKVLNKLNDKQSRDFQAEIVNLFVDANQNVDNQTFADIMNNIGFQSFVLEMLGNVINRSPFKNQYELNRNLDLIAETLKKDQEQLQKRQKILQRKEEKLKTTEQQLLSTCKQKITAMETQSIKKITQKENEIKKSINLSLNQLKAKEKLVLERYEAIKASNKTLAQMEAKEKSINQKLKILEKRQRQSKSKGLQQSLFKKDNKVNELQDSNDKLRQNLRQLNLKYKNMELAYRKVKNDNEKLANERKVQIKEKSASPEQKTKVMQKIAKAYSDHLDQLELSMIHIKGSQASQQVVCVVNPYAKKTGKVVPAVQIAANKLKEKIELQSLLEDSHIQEPKVLQVEALSFLQDEADSVDAHEHLLSQIKALDLQFPQSKIKFIESDTLSQYLQQITLLRYPCELCTWLLQSLLPLMDTDEAHQKVAAYLSKQSIVSHLMKMYLNHETNSDIAEYSTLILSRIKLWQGSLCMNEAFRKAIQIRKRVENEDTMLCLNIKYLLQ